MSNKTFDIIRLIAELILPISALVSGLSEIFGFTLGMEIAAALVVVDTFMGAFVEVARKIYNNKN